MEPLQVLILSEDPLAALGAASLLETFDDLIAIQPVADDPFDLAADVVLWIPDRNGGEEFPPPEPELPTVAVVDGAAEADRALANGATSALSRSIGAEALAAALRATARGLRVLEPGFGTLAFTTARPGEPPEELTDRELEVLKRVVAGDTNKAIASHLDISPSTVKFHLNVLLGKFGARTRTELAVEAIRLGLVAI